MNNWNGFGSLDLSDVEEASGYVKLEPGTYYVEATNAEIKDTKTNGKMIVVDFASVDGHGDMRMNFNIVNKNQKAVEIGMRQLKSFLVASNHKNPDRPGDIATLKGLKCYIVVGMGKPWRDEQGNNRLSTEIKAFKAEDSTSPHAQKTPEQSHNITPNVSDLDDDIPF